MNAKLDRNAETKNLLGPPNGVEVTFRSCKTYRHLSTQQNYLKKAFLVRLQML